MRFVFAALLLSACIGSDVQPLQSGQDVDHDGVADVHDKCPYNPGPDMNSGCPMSSPGHPSMAQQDPGPPSPPGPAAGSGAPGGTNGNPQGMVGGAKGDVDGDGIMNDFDRCPDVPEDRDGFQDDDGCPDPDNDSDGVPDVQDKCPNEPETKNGFQDLDGCPDTAPAGTVPPPPPAPSASPSAVPAPPAPAK
jgi:hypothetical protein